MAEEPVDVYDHILLSAGCTRSVRLHCRKVREAAREYVIDGVVDRDLVEAGAALHDIGRAKTHSIAHGQVGADICREMGLPEEIARIVECHVGAGIPPCECILLGLAPRDCVPFTIEERIVAHADNTVQGQQITLLPETVMTASLLPRKIRRRLYRLALEMHLFRA
ncbi:MAG: HDIG domain-containing protein [Methanomicrobiales archaeon]|nr:HDIG domain-containing protein [Methanomicrobiales archaeon]